jgi:glycosyltransferase involved in cell wall biosynthesis
MNLLISAVSRFTEPTGICRYASSLALGVARLKRFDVTIAVASWQCEYFREVFKAHRHATIKPIRIRNSPSDRNRWTLFGLPRVASRLKADAVHLAYPVPFIRKLFSSPVVMTVHDLYPFDSPGNFRFPFVNRKILEFSLRQSDAVVCISANTSRRLSELFPVLGSSVLTETIHNPVEIPELSDSQGPVKGLRVGQFLLAVAQHRANKNLDLLIRTYANIRDLGNAADRRLVIVGSDGPETPKLHALVNRLNLSDHVYFLSSIDGSTLAWLYRSCSTVVICSSYEGFCIPLVEAISLGATVVCSDIAVLREIGSDRCSYFSLTPFPEQALADVLLYSPAGQNSAYAEAFRARFEPATIAESYQGIYEQIVAAARDPTLHKWRVPSC